MFFKTGTVENKDRKFFICLGAGRHQIPLMRAARELGFQVIAVDRNTQAPGFAEADISLFCSITRPRKIFTMLMDNHAGGEICGVGARSFGAANYTAAHLARLLNVPGPDPKSLSLFKNKRLLKEQLKSAGVPAPEQYGWKTFKEKYKLQHASLPLLIRPTNSHGKLGIQIVHEPKEIKNFLKENPKDNNQYLIEEIVQGAEVTVLGIIEAGRYIPVCISDKLVSQSPPHFAELTHRYPSRISPEIQSKIHGYMQKIIEATNLTTGPIVAEFLIKKDKPLLVEVVPEIGGEYIADMIAPLGAGYSYFKELIKIYTGKPAQKKALRNQQKCIFIRFIPQQEGLLRKFEFPIRLKSNPGLIFSHQMRKPDDRTSVTRGNLDRLGVFALQGPIHDMWRLEKEVELITKETQIEYENTNPGLEHPLPEVQSPALLPR